jgi:hypothetical protein
MPSHKNIVSFTSKGINASGEDCSSPPYCLAIDLKNDMFYIMAW